MEFVHQFGDYCSFTILSLQIHAHGMSFHLLGLLNFFQNVLWFPMLVNLSQSIFLDAILHEIIVLISLLDYTLLVYTLIFWWYWGHQTQG
jgi:hypothetical protein